MEFSLLYTFIVFCSRINANFYHKKIQGKLEFTWKYNQSEIYTCADVKFVIDWLE